MDVRTEAAAIAQLKAGDMNGLTPLVLAYQQRAGRIAYLITQDVALAEDVTQAAFLRAVESIGGFDSRRRFLPWFSRIVVNAALHTVKLGERQQPLDTVTADDLTVNDLLTDTVPDPETQVERRETQQTVRRLLEELTPEQRAVIVLRYYVEYSEREMAIALNIPQGTVKSRLNTARERLRGLFPDSLKKGIIG